jgi:hypothetical protein
MQPVQLLILDSQAARNRLRQTFELPDVYGSGPEPNGVVQSWGDRPASLRRPWKQYSRINTKRVCAVTVVIGTAAIGAVFYANNQGNQNKGRITVTAGCGARE